MYPHIFAEDKQRYYCRDLVLGCMGSIARLSSTIGKQDYHQNFGKVFELAVYCPIGQNSVT